MPEQSTETEERIFEAALAVFSSKGKDGARMQAIADAAGINKAMLHYYFRSKDRLYEAVFDHVFLQFMGALREAVQDVSSVQTMLRLFIDRYITFLQQHPAVMRLMVLENLAGAPVVGPRMEAYMRDLEQAPPRLFMAKMQAAAAAGEIRPVDPFQTFMTLIGASVFFFLAQPTLAALNPSLAAHPEAAVEARKQHLFDLVYYGLEPHAPHADPETS